MTKHSSLNQFLVSLLPRQNARRAEYDRLQQPLFAQKMRFKCLVCFLGSALYVLLVGLAEAQSLSDVGTTATTEDYSGADFSGESVTISVSSWGRADNFSGADFTGANFTINSVNQPMLDSNIAGADFTGATFNWTPDGYMSLLRQQTARLTGTRYSYANFSDTVWNIVLSRSTFRNSTWFNDGAGATSAASAANVLNLSGADFNFSGTDTSLADDVGALLIANLGGFDGTTAIGAYYDDEFLANNYSSFGYASAQALEDAMVLAGWQYLADGVSPTFHFYDISSSATVPFDSTTDRLMNGSNLLAWGSGQLTLSDTSNLSGIDFTALGLDSWAIYGLSASSNTVWDSANLAGMSISVESNNFGYNDSMVGINLSGATVTTSVNQPFFGVDLTSANLSGAVFNITPSAGAVNAFRDATLVGADFSDSVWNYVTSGTLTSTTLFENGTAGLSADNKEDAPTFEGANLASITGAAKTAIISNLGGFDGDVAIGAKYNHTTLTLSGWTSAELDAAGWQYVFDESLLSDAVSQSGDVPIVFNPDAAIDNIEVLMAGGAAHNTGQSMRYDNLAAKHFWMDDFNDRSDWFQWEISLSEAAEYHVDALLRTNTAGESFSLSVVETGETLEFEKSDTGWRKLDAGTISLPAGTSTLRLLRTSAVANVEIKSLELVRASDYAAYLQRISDFKVDTTWFSQAGYGLMFQAGAWGYPQAEEPALPRDQVVRKTLEEYTNDFDLDSFIEMVKGTGASYVIWSLTWAEYLMCAPIEAVDTYFGHSDNTATRDLIGEMADALDAEGINFMLYYHRGEAEDVPWFQEPAYPLTEFTARGTGDRSVFFDSWEAIITEVGNRYGEKLDGWFIDGGLVYYPAPFERFGAALRAGNANRLISYNPWVVARYTDFQDVMFGEGHIGGPINGSAPAGGDGILIGGKNEGLLQHGMFEMENAWGVTNPNQAINTHVTPEEGVTYVANSKAINVPISFNMMMWEDGTVSEDSLAVFDAIQGIEPVDPETTEISTATTMDFSSDTDVLSNTNGITAWGTSHLILNDGSDLEGVDFTALGITSWTNNSFGSSAVTNFNSANLSGLQLTFSGHNFGYNDTMVGTNFSGVTLDNDGGYNQFFLFTDLRYADFSGATLNIYPDGVSMNAFRGAQLTGADFTNITWGVSTAGATSLVANFFSGGPGSTSAADKHLAVNFEGADLSLIVGDAKTNMINNLGGFDGSTPIGALYNQSTLDNSGWTSAELDAAGWQDTTGVVTTSYSITEASSILFDSSLHALENSTLLSNWGLGHLNISDGSNLTDVDIAGLGVTSWTSNTFGTSVVTVWDGINLSGMTLNFSGHNFGYNDSMVGADFSGTTIYNDGGYNQFFLFTDLTDADFSGATLNITPNGVRMNAFRDAVLTGADFSHITWGVSTASATDLVANFFSGGPGTTGVADRDRAVTFEGADLSLITGDARTNMITNLGGFDGDIPIGAKFDKRMLRSSAGWTLSELLDAGWQFMAPRPRITKRDEGFEVIISDLPEEANVKVQRANSLDGTWEDVTDPVTGSSDVYWMLENTQEKAFYRIVVD